MRRRLVRTTYRPVAMFNDKVYDLKVEIDRKKPKGSNCNEKVNLYCSEQQKNMLQSHSLGIKVSACMYSEDCDTLKTTSAPLYTLFSSIEHILGDWWQNEMRRTNPKVFVLMLIGSQSSLLSSPLPGNILSNHEDFGNCYIWILLEHVGFSVMLIMSEVPPVGTTSLSGEYDM